MMFIGLGRAAFVAACAGAAAAGGPLPRSALSVKVGGAWHEWWRSTSAPVRYGAATSALASSVRWRGGATGVSWAELELSGSGEAWRTRVVIARIDPHRVRFALDTASDGAFAAWSLTRTSPRAVAAVNAGQFLRSMPWGWVVLDGREFLRPSIAPLVSTFTVAADGTVALTHASLPPAQGVRWAFQSYPTLLAAEVVPEPLRRAGCGVDVAHRDARLALGIDGDGRLLVALTRFDGFDGALDVVPLGLTTPEMAAVMGALGATDAVLLDGGISAQLLVRDAAGTAHRWPGLRKVPLALVAYPRERSGATVP